MKKFILILFLFNGVYLSAQSCRDTVFNMTRKQFICELKLLGEWRQDSVGTSLDSMILCKEKWIWSLGAKKYLSIIHYTQPENYSEIGEYKFRRGYLEFGNFTLSIGGKYLGSIAFELLSVAPNRMVINGLSHLGYKFIVLKRVMK